MTDLLNLNRRDAERIGALNVRIGLFARRHRMLTKQIHRVGLNDAELERLHVRRTAAHESYRQLVAERDAILAKAHPQ